MTETSPGTPRWYAMKVFFNRVFDIRDLLTNRGVTTYLPLTERLVKRGGTVSRVETPLISSLLFFHTTPSVAVSLAPEIEGRAMIYTRRNGLQRTPVAIPDKEMDIFMLVTSGGKEGVEYLGDDSPRYHLGDRVRVTDGPFTGSEGHIARIKNNNRLVVTVKGLCAVATSYIPRAFLEKIETTTPTNTIPPDR
ncbi:MAG: UpxY family transcription antiterminator [Duncaniella sp.]|nr:UpxY family transcription antiterminator [Duncaniella sp.]